MVPKEEGKRAKGRNSQNSSTENSQLSGVHSRANFTVRNTAHPGTNNNISPRVGYVSGSVSGLTRFNIVSQPEENTTVEYILGADGRYSIRAHRTTDS